MSNFSECTEQRNSDYLEACGLCEQAFTKEGVEIKQGMCEPPVKASVIYVTGEEIVVRDGEAFSKICRLASNWEVYPRTDSTVKMAFIFYWATLSD